MEKIRIGSDGWVKSGEGATAVSYNDSRDSHRMMKVFSSSIVGPQYAQTEFRLSRKLADLGLKTPRAIEMVEYEGFPAIIYERIIHKKSISRLCASNYKEIDRWASLFARECRVLHSTVCKGGDFVSRKEQMLDFVNTHKGYTERTKRKIAALAQELGDGRTCLHGDLQTGNLIVDPDTKEAYWIDLGSFACGNPMYDIACLHFFCMHPVGRIIGRKLCHMNFIMLSRFWKAFEREYCRETGMTDLSEKASRYLILYLVYTIGLENYDRLATLAFDRYINLLAINV